MGISMFDVRQVDCNFYCWATKPIVALSNCCPSNIRIVVVFATIIEYCVFNVFSETWLLLVLLFLT